MSISVADISSVAAVADMSPDATTADISIPLARNMALPATGSMATRRIAIALRAKLMDVRIPAPMASGQVT
jgi:hypothetical protein